MYAKACWPAELSAGNFESAAVQSGWDGVRSRKVRDTVRVHTVVQSVTVHRVTVHFVILLAGSQ